MRLGAHQFLPQALAHHTRCRVGSTRSLPFAARSTMTQTSSAFFLRKLRHSTISFALFSSIENLFMEMDEYELLPVCCQKLSNRKIRKTSRKRTKTTGSKHIVSPDAHGHNSSSPQNTATMKSHAAMLGG